MNKTVLLTCFLLLGLQVNSGAFAASDREYTYGVFPYLSAVRLEPIYVPIAVAMSERLNRKVDFRTSTEFKRFFTKLQQERFDIALIQPFWYPPAVDRFNYLPLVRPEEPLTAKIMVLDDSPVRSVADLKNKVIASPPAFVPVVHMARRTLVENGLDPDLDLKLNAFKTVDSCFQQVVIGKAAGCIAPHFAQASIERKLGIRLRAVLETSSIPGISVVVHSRIPIAERKKLKALLLSWGENETEREVLSSINTERFVPASDHEYDPVRVLVKKINAADN